MKRTLELLCIGLIAGGLLTGCPKKPEETPATATQTTPAPQTAAQPATATQTTQAAAEPVNEENYNKALFEKTCVTAKVEDTEEQKAIITEIYARYGFDEETFAAAQEQMKDKPEVTAALTAKMGECTPELAASFKTGEAGTTAGTTGKEEATKDKPKKPSKSWKAGAYSDGSVTGGNLEGAKLRLKINDDGKISGSFQGKREGKGFSIPVNGEISKDGAFTATGNRGPNNARVSGRYKSGQVQGSIQGAINKQGFKVNYVAK